MGEVVCHEGDLADSVHLVAEGRLSVRVSLPSGDAAMVNLLGPGDYFGELALLRKDGRRTATITAIEKSRTLVITETAFNRVCDAHPQMQRSLAALLADRIDKLSHRSLELMYLGLDRRVYRRLLELALSYRDDPTRSDVTVVVPFTQTQLADLTGGTRPSVNQALQRLVDERIVSLGRGRIEVHDLKALHRRCGVERL